jgi:hypothetical protein
MSTAAAPSSNIERRSAARRLEYTPPSERIGSTLTIPMTAGRRERSRTPAWASWRLAGFRPARSKASCARPRSVAGSAFRLSTRRARERTTGGEADPSSLTTSTGNSDAANVAGRNPSQEAISRSCAALSAGMTRSAETFTPAVYWKVEDELRRVLSS